MSDKVKWPLDRLVETANRAVELATTYKDPLTERLPAGAIEGLAADSVSFSELVSKATRSTIDLASSTASQNELAEKGRDFISGARMAISRSDADENQKKKFGIGLQVNKKQLSTVIAGLDALVDGYDAHTEFARLAGMLESDREKAIAYREAITKADSAQEKKKERRKLTTAERDALAVRIEKAVDKIIGAGSLHFYDQPEIAQLFRDLIP